MVIKGREWQISAVAAATAAAYGVPLKQHKCTRELEFERVGPRWFGGNRRACRLPPSANRNERFSHSLCVSYTQTQIHAHACTIARLQIRPINGWHSTFPKNIFRKFNGDGRSCCCWNWQRVAKRAPQDYTVYDDGEQTHTTRIVDMYVDIRCCCHGCFSLRITCHGIRIACHPRWRREMGEGQIYTWMLLSSLLLPSSQPMLTTFRRMFRAHSITICHCQRFASDDRLGDLAGSLGRWQKWMASWMSWRMDGI